MGRDNPMSKTSITRAFQNVVTETTGMATGTVKTVSAIAFASFLMWGVTSLNKAVASPFKDKNVVERPAQSASPKAAVSYKF